MNNFPRGLVYFTTTALAIGALCFQQWQPVTVSKHARSVLVQARGKNSAPLAKREVTSSRVIEPAPLDHPSEQELIDYPGATVVESEEIDDPEVSDQKIRMRILKTNFKSPYIRTEEMIDANSRALLGRVEMAADHLLLNLPEGSDPQEIFNNFGPEVASMEPVTPDSSLWRVDLADISLAALPDVLYFKTAGMGEPDRIYGLNDLIIEQANENQWALPKISAPEAWKTLNPSAKPVIVAIIDTGIRYTHQDLQGAMWTNPDSAAPDRYGTNAAAHYATDSATDTVGGNNDPNDPMDDCGHGTHCAGIIGGMGVGIRGVAPQVQLMACKYMNAQGRGMLSDEIGCLHYAVDHGATVLNCSYGLEIGFSQNGFSLSTPYSLFSRAEYDAMKYVRDKGAVVSVAAGNESKDNDQFCNYPASYCVGGYNLLGKKIAPALDNIVSVAATDEQDQLCDFSNYGAKGVFMAAPGNNILSTWNYSDTAYTFLRGTSMAAPHVAGALALMKEKFPHRPNQKIIEHLLDATDSLPSLEGKTKAGRLNLLKALTWD
ncbi:MAG: hypothetical protein FJ390_02005 [Verrucomicrobia bacterium]|nr:hypothetical protein [Verrucomicrobiota bacterium]